MLPRINPTNTQAWFLLKKHHDEEMSRRHMRDLFAADKERFHKFSRPGKKFHCTPFYQKAWRRPAGT